MFIGLKYVSLFFKNIVVIFYICLKLKCNLKL
jgi:hypothetical protein